MTTERYQVLMAKASGYAKSASIHETDGQTDMAIKAYKEALSYLKAAAGRTFDEREAITCRRETERVQNKLAALKKVHNPVTATDEMDFSIPEQRVWDSGFSSIGGYDELKDVLRLELSPLDKPEVCEKYGKKPSNILLWGPPGCCKTTIVHALSHELKVPVMDVRPSDCMHFLFGQSEQALKLMFQKLERIMFLDEIDSFGRKRGTVSANQHPLLSQLLMEMSHLSSNGTSKLIIAATNEIWSIDPALRRRFQKLIYVPAPDETARAQIFRIELAKRAQVCNLQDIDMKFLLIRTAGFSGADICNLVEEAAARPLKRALNGGPHLNISNEDFSHALRKIKSSLPAWFIHARNELEKSGESRIFSEIAEQMTEMEGIVEVQCNYFDKEKGVME